MEDQEIQPLFHFRSPKEAAKSPDVPQPDDTLLHLLPASYCTNEDDLVALRLDDPIWIRSELNTGRLDKVIKWLWVAGRPMPPRPLHHQILKNREIIITEEMDMHLVWTTGRMFLKPLPRFLLEPQFWRRYLYCHPHCTCSKDEQGNMPSGRQECTERVLWKCAMGFLFSYAALIRHESDFMIAQEKHLLPTEVRWAVWRSLVRELNTEHIYSDIAARFIYGELRLSRLNKIYRLSQGQFLRGYVSRWDQYGSFFKDNFTWLASTTVYIIIILTAMQVGLGTDRLASSGAFQSASYGFTVFSILGPFIATGLTVIVFCCIFVNNWIATVAFWKKRFRRIQT